MTSPDFDDLLRRHYPKAMAQPHFRDEIRARLLAEGINPGKTLLVTSICADDVLAVHEPDSRSFGGKLKREFLGPFSMGGLAGLPYSGLTGLAAAAHHVPEDGTLLLAYGPHIGMGEEGGLGKLLRPYQSCESDACGALALALRHFAMPGYQPTRDEDDIEQSALEGRLWPHRAEIMAAAHPLKTATDHAYAIIHDSLWRYVRARKQEFHCDRIALVGGVIINTGQDRDDYIDLRDWAVLKVAEL